MDKEKKHQEKLEEAGYRSPTWSILRALQSVNGAKRLYGESAITAAPIFEAAGRGDKPYWGGMGRGSANDYSVGESGRRRQRGLSGGDENIEKLGGVVQEQEERK